ncbi:tripartite tricarboxylate transporter substrate binding protein [Cupriavidus basilensis]|uniref:Tripartite tricarboxylate transporter substrate binding protein n=1 Tax=Cupriavidus basilensis TaxID=68895 RepID=A0ABT6AVR5_9BURK|nr:tripartite tricarboxylate transporter substrate binding protein [Cupriavidus basilensis]MDF3836717.1 tripartite tricarboxylate transporter substrate binding protein [Cupriavidus basilensis]
MKRFVANAVAGIVLFAAATVQAQEKFPSRPIRIVVPSAAGGLADIATRMVAQKMGEKLGQPVVVENRPGADTMLGTRYVRSVAADGYTLLTASGTLVSQLVVKQDPGYDLKDFAGIGPLVRSPWVMLTGPSQPDKNLSDFIARAKAHPADMSFASNGVGTAPYMAEQMFLQRAGLNLLHIPYKGIATAMPDVISGRVTMIFDAISSSAGYVRSGQLRALGVTSANRLPIFPNVPTIAEQGMPGFRSYVTIGLVARAETPKEIVSKLAAVLQSALASKEVREFYEANGAESISASPDEFTEMLKRDHVEFGKLAAQLGIQKQ